MTMKFQKCLSMTDAMIFMALWCAHQTDATLTVYQWVQGTFCKGKMLGNCLDL